MRQGQINRRRIRIGIHRWTRRGWWNAIEMTFHLSVVRRHLCRSVIVEGRWRRRRRIRRPVVQSGEKLRLRTRTMIQTIETIEIILLRMRQSGGTDGWNRRGRTEFERIAHGEGSSCTRCFTAGCAGQQHLFWIRSRIPRYKRDEQLPFTYRLRFSFDCDGVGELAGGVLRALLRFWKTLGVEPRKQRSCIAPFARRGTYCFDRVWMARVRCRVLGVSSIQNLAETKARSTVSRQQVHAFRSYSVLTRKRRSGTSRWSTRKLPAFINRVRVIELRDRGIGLSVELSPLVFMVWVVWSSMMRWWISSRKKNKGFFLRRSVSLLPSYCWLFNGCPPSNLAIDEFRRRCWSGVSLELSNQTSRDEGVKMIETSRLPLVGGVVATGVPWAWVVSGVGNNVLAGMWLWLNDESSEFELSSTTSRAGNEEDGEDGDGGDVWDWNERVNEERK